MSTHNFGKLPFPVIQAEFVCKDLSKGRRMVSFTRNYGLVRPVSLSRMDIHMAMYPCLYSLTISPSLSHYCFCDVWRIIWYRLVCVFFFHLESNFFNRLSYQMHQDMGSLSVASCCIARIACSLISSKTFLWPYVLVISLWETVWLDQDMWSNVDTLVWPGPCTTRITIDLDEKVNWFWLI